MNLLRASPGRLALLGIVGSLAVGACSRESTDAGRTPPNPPLLIEPNACVGQIRAGMTVQQVVQQLGEPQRRTSTALEYTRLGFAVLPGPGGIIQVVMCGDVIGMNGPLVDAFTGRTKEGIGMKSTREEILRAYGEPAESKKFPGGLESMHYPNLGMTFTLEGGRVHHMIVRFPLPSEPDRTITLEPAQPSP